MEERYPNSVLKKILRDNKLSQPEVSALEKILSLDGMQAAIEQGTIEAAALLKSSAGQGDSCTILPEGAAKELIELYKATKTKPLIASKHIKISEFIFWFTFKSVTYAYIPVRNVAELILETPAKKPELQTCIQENAEEMEKWLSIKKDILTCIPRGLPRHIEGKV